MPLSAEERFNQKWVEEPETKCHTWTASLTNGYGQFGFGGKTYRAHVWIWKHLNGDIPLGLEVCPQLQQ